MSGEFEYVAHEAFPLPQMRRMVLAVIDRQACVWNVVAHIAGGVGGVEIARAAIRITSYNVCYTKLLRLGVEHGYGHRELGARAHRIGEREQPTRDALKAGININDLGINDPTVAGRSVWIDSISGTAVRNGLPARLTRA